MPSLSPDGTLVAFVTFCAGKSGIWSVPTMANTADQCTVGSQVVVDGSRPAWGPNGLFAYEQGQQPADIMLINGGHAGSTFNLTVDPGDDRNPNWSPEGKPIPIQ
jgi:Tol biopolymer transport system component